MAKVSIYRSEGVLRNKPSKTIFFTDLFFLFFSVGLSKLYTKSGTFITNLKWSKFLLAMVKDFFFFLIFSIFLQVSFKTFPEGFITKVFWVMAEKWSVPIQHLKPLSNIFFLVFFFPFFFFYLSVWYPWNFPFLYCNTWKVHSWQSNESFFLYSIPLS